MARHFVKSGLTGWAQVNGLRGDTSVRARLRYDMYYLENWSILFDLKVLFMTIFAHRNAY
jgi:lipopolysaccharide/colanic/teichoic acid biosynthesis glycosyltransferase